MSTPTAPATVDLDRAVDAYLDNALTITTGIKAALAAVRFPDLKAAALALYMAGRWTVPGVTDEVQERLWEGLRDALMLRPGTATAIPTGPDLFHDFIRTGDADAHAAIMDRNGEVVLLECRRCNQAEGDLAKTCPGPRMAAKAVPGVRGAPHGCPVCDDAIACDCAPRVAA